MVGCSPRVYRPSRDAGVMRLATPDDVSAVLQRRRVVTAIPLDLRPVTLAPPYLRFVERVSGQRVVGPTLLHTFLRLHDAPDSRILAFAKRWGNLGLCEHGRFIGLCQCSDEAYDENGPIERLSDWRAWSDRFRALLTLTRQVESAWNPETVQRAFAGWWRTEDADRLAHAGQRIRRVEVAVALSRLLVGARVRREVVVTPGHHWAIVDGSRWLCGAIVLQLVQQCVGVGSMAVCGECGQAFEADRRTAKWCSRCRRAGAPEKRRQQAMRDRRRAVGRTSRNRPSR